MTDNQLRRLVDILCWAKDHPIAKRTKYWPLDYSPLEYILRAKR